MNVNDLIRDKYEEGDDDLVTLIASYLSTTKSLEVANGFLNNDMIKLVKDQNMDMQKFAINKYFQSLLVTTAGERMVKTEIGLDSTLDVRPPLLNLTNSTNNLEWYNLVVNGVIKFCYDNSIELK